MMTERLFECPTCKEKQITTVVKVELGEYREGSYRAMTADDRARCSVCGREFDEIELSAIAPKPNAN